MQDCMRPYLQSGHLHLVHRSVLGQRQYQERTPSQRSGSHGWSRPSDSPRTTAWSPLRSGPLTDREMYWCSTSGAGRRCPRPPAITTFQELTRPPIANSLTPAPTRSSQRTNPRPDTASSGSDGDIHGCRCDGVRIAARTAVSCGPVPSWDGPNECTTCRPRRRDRSAGAIAVSTV